MRPHPGLGVIPGIEQQVGVDVGRRKESDGERRGHGDPCEPAREAQARTEDERLDGDAAIDAGEHRLRKREAVLGPTGEAVERDGEGDDGEERQESRDEARGIAPVVPHEENEADENEHGERRRVVVVDVS